jgi:hypothetical protein
MNPRVLVAVLVVAGVGGGAFYWWRKQHQPVPAPPPVVAQPAPAPAAPPPPTAPEPAIHNPIESGEAGGLPPLASSDDYMKKVLTELFGKKSVLAFLSLDGFAQRFVSTVDNLANERAPVQLWPVNVTSGRFQPDGNVEGALLGAANAQRYVPFVRFASGVDTRRAVSLYVRLYPLFQQAYEELGFPGKYFNDRVVEVIDHLMATPEPPEPVRLRLVEVKGASASGRAPIYQFEDPSLEGRSAGQKILLRMGRENAAALKSKLAEVRAQIATGAAARKLSKR